MNTIAVEIPLEEVSRMYLKLGGYIHVHRVDELNESPSDFFQLQVTDRKEGKETALHFCLMNGPREIHSMTITVRDLFSLPQMLREMKDEIRDIRAFVVAHGSNAT